MTPDERQQCIDRIAALPLLLEEQVCTLSPLQLTTRFVPGEWTVAQNVHHLADSHMNAYVRVKLILTEDAPIFKPYDQVAWAETPDASHERIGDSLHLLRGLHKRWVDLFTSLTEDQWLRYGVHPEYNRRYTVEDILRTYAGHGEAHLDQIARTLKAAGS